MAVIGVKSGGEVDKRGSTLSRVTASRARRRLFPPMTDEEVANAEAECREQELFIDEEKSRQWNFDFRRMRPLPGRWQWEPVTGAATQQTPPGSSAVDRRPDDASPTAPAAVPLTDEATPSPVVSTAVVVTPSPSETSTSGAEPRPTRKRRRQSTLTGIY